MVVKTPVNEREIMTDPNQFGAAPENNQPNPQPEQPTQPLQPMQPEHPTESVPSTPEYGQYAQPNQAANGEAASTPSATQPIPAYTPVPEYGAYAPSQPAQPAQPAQPTPEYGQYAQSANNSNTQPAAPQYGQYGQYTGPANTSASQQPGNPYIGGQYAGPTPTGAPYTQPQGAPYTGSTNQYQDQYANPYGQAPQYGAPLPQGVPGYMPGDQSIGMVPLDQPDYRCTFGNAVKRFFTKYAVFSGRASRREFWWVILFFVLCNIALSIIGGMFAFISTAVPTILSVVWTLATIVPYVALAVRRVHDTNKSGWWVLLPGIPYVISEIVNYTAIMPATDRITDTILGVAAGLDEDVATQQLISQMNGLAAPSALVTICSLIFLISGLVLMCGAPKPEGARFDVPRSGSSTPQTPAPSTSGYNAGSQPGNDPYATGGNPFTPQNQ